MTAGNIIAARAAAGAFAVSQLPQQLQNRVLDFYTYSIEINPAGAGTTTPGTVTIGADADFTCVWLSGFVTDITNVAQIATPFALVQLTDGSSGRQLSDKPVQWMNLFGTAQLPFVLPYPKFFQRNNTVQMTYQNLEGSSRVVRVSMHGFKVFGLPSTGNA